MPAFLQALAVLKTGDPKEKKAAAHQLSTDWAATGDLGRVPGSIPEAPARPLKPQLNKQ